MAHSGDTQNTFLKTLAETPFISYASKKVGLSRSTVYRWMKENYSFRVKVLNALTAGRENTNDIVESVLIKKARDGDLGAIKFYLSHNAKRYSGFADRIMDDSLQKSVFRNPDGSLKVSKKTAALLEQMDKEERQRKAHALGLPETPL